MQEFQCQVTDALGLHARPAGALVRDLADCPCNVQVRCGDKTADGKRLMQVMRLAAKCGDTLHFYVEGTNEQNAAQALELFCKSNI
ncbi:MAG: HPr family phosphocarrier protein [Faecalibacterium sp.]|jgi:phosphocarrier protein|nr:HPr family phosphocarrier protein [Faecalibacterium sp.]